ncbi:MAG: ferritin-like domain-containing protein [Gemmatimonadota bacterium]
MKMESLRDLYIQELKDLYSAETQILKALPKMAKAATHPELQSAFEEHLDQTRMQKARLEEIFEALGDSPRGKTCKGMKGIISEGSDLLGEDAEPAVLDAGLIAAAQHVEHYEIAGYGCVRAYAELLGEHHAVTLLQQSLDEEETTDRKLTALAGRLVNVDANVDESATSRL